MANSEFFIGRQPIMDRDSQLFGYELLFRGGFKPNEAVFDSADHATAVVINNSMMGFGLQNIVGQNQAFINFPENFFLNTEPPCFASEGIVVEVLEDVPPTEEVIEGIKRLKKLGYKIALDDFIFKKRLLPLIEMADIIKFDVQYVKPDNIHALFSKVKQVTNVQIVAERVETKEMFDVCKNAGADYFQGYFFAKPEIVSGKQLNVGRHNLVLLLEKVADDNLHIEQLIEIVERDVGLTHKLMKMAEQYKSSGMPDFASLREVMMLFGLKRVQSWATLVSMSILEDLVPEVFNIARIRAIFMRSLAKYNGLGSIDSYYLTGLFSMLGAILQQNLEEALSHLPINEDIKQGICEGQNNYGQLLAVARRFETSMHDEGVNPEYAKLYISALTEVGQMEL
ncbi:EAL and HDOD domain-containing protein [Hydrogenovibrio kuenenii]|uniref:EAL and HDOD domain-containing protein n=1 Tax=Hydrogenovibrio kuenenii TaxID=63658 RepID=UPI0004665E15|nr:EAL domain-containing protein [Hydrogenovibrio kuenenii]